MKPTIFWGCGGFRFAPPTLQLYANRIYIKMAFIEKFSGRRVEIPEDRNYHAKQGLWAKSGDEEIILGLTEPAIILAGGVNDLDWLVREGETVHKEQDTVFVLTGKILYISTPVSGTVSFNHDAKQNPPVISDDPYGKGWLFRIRPDADAEHALQLLADPAEYLESLKGTEGFKNPEGLKGGVSGMCKAVYSGIRGQTLPPYASS